MNIFEQGQDRIFKECTRLFETAESVFTEEKGSLNSNYFFEFGQNRTADITGGRWSIRGGFHSSGELKRFEIGFKPTVQETIALSPWGFQFDPTLVIEKDPQGEIHSVIEYWPRTRMADKKTIPLARHPSLSEALLRRIYSRLSLSPQSVETILVNPIFLENPESVAIGDEGIAVRRLVLNTPSKCPRLTPSGFFDFQLINFRKINQVSSQDTFHVYVHLSSS